jgi:hypothetical protein
MKRATWSVAALAAVTLMAGSALAAHPEGREPRRGDGPNIVLAHDHGWSHHGGYRGREHFGVYVRPYVALPAPVVVVPPPAVVPPPVYYPYPDYRVYRYYPDNSFYYRGPRVGFSIHF